MKLLKNINNFHIILGSKSPRRNLLLKEMGFKFDVIVKEVEESYPDNLKPEQIALYVAEIKADAFNADELNDNDIVITADTIVCFKDEILLKPKNYNDAYNILKKLSANKHKVITGICLKSKYKQKSFFVSTDVYFKNLSDDEIKYYIENYQPYDKAGAYGIQEWIGYVGIERIEGSYFNVVGLPTHVLYEELLKFSE